MEGSRQSTASLGRDVSPARFLILFVLLYGVLHAIYFAIPDRMLAQYLHQPGIAAPAAALAGWVSADAEVAGIDGSLRSPRAVVRIVRGCDGAGLALLLTSAVGALPGRARARATGIVFAVAFVGVINVIRVAGLYLIAAYRVDWFPLAHDLLMPSFLVMLAGLSFAWWSRRSAVRDPVDA